MDFLVFGQQLRHFRKAAGLTLDELGAIVGKPAPYLSMVENGKREPKISLITEMATALDIEVTDLLSTEPPTRRGQLEIELEKPILTYSKPPGYALRNGQRDVYSTWSA